MERTNELVVKYLRYLRAQPKYETAETMDVAISCLAELFGLTGNEQSAELLNMVEAADPGAKLSPTELKQQANEAMKKADYKTAHELYSRAIEQSAREGEGAESRSIYYANRAAAYKGMGQTDEAIKDLTESVKLNPGYQKAWLRLALHYEELGKKDQAYKIYLAQNTENPCQQTKDGVERTKPAGMFDALPSKEELLQKFPMLGDAINDPAIQELLQKPSVAEKISQVQSNPMAALSLMSDPEMQPIVTAIMGKLKGALGGALGGFMGGQ